MNYDATWIIDRLPPIELIWRRTEPDFYGASHLIAKQVGKNVVPVSFATWRHGWVDAKYIKYVKILLNSDRFDLTHLVATEDHAASLKEFGYPTVQAVGMPFIYADEVTVKRKAGSLLVMPGHSLYYTGHNWNQKRYVQQISNLKPHFNTIVACLHSSCFSKEHWISEFQEHGIPCIRGADSYDKNSLLRMKTAFKSFEYMTTNTVGSHIIYAAHAGCKVSIYGDYGIYRKEDFQNDPLYKSDPDLLDFAIEFSSERSIKTKYPMLFAVPMESSARVEWGQKMTGFKYKRSPHEIASLLGWSLEDQIKGYIREAVRLSKEPSSLLGLMQRCRFRNDARYLRKQ